MNSNKIKNQNKNEKRGRMKMTLGFMRGAIGFFITSIIAALLLAIVDTLGPKIISVTVDNVLGNKPAELPEWALSLIDSLGGFEYFRSHLYYIALLLVVLGLLTAIFQYCNRVFNARGAETLVKNMRDSIFAHIDRLPFSWHMKNQTGDIIQRCTSDVDTVKRFLSDQMTAVFRIIIMLCLSLYFMFSMNVRLALVAVAFMPFIIGYSALFHRKIGRRFAVCDENEGILSAIAQENLTGVRVVRAFGRESYEREKFTKQNEYYTGLWVDLHKTFSVFWSTSDLLSGIWVMCIVVVGAVMCVRGDGMTAGKYIAFISYNAMLMWPIRQLGRMISEMSKAGVSLGRIYQIMSAEEERDKPDAVTPDMHGDIRFEHVSFAYEGCPEILSDINFSIKAGTTLGILGGTGSGKSTLMYLLDRLYDIPDGCGRITVGGVDIADMKAAWVRENIGMVLQEPFLFSKSIAENVGITKENIGLSEIRRAAKIACLDDTVISFSKGYDTFVGERGVTLSGGQKQRTAIARLIVQRTPIMVFDDSLSAVDTETDSKIRHALAENLGKSTVILISHRITTLMQAEKIIVLDKGRIAEEGTHSELISKGGLYKQIYEIQTKGAEEAI
ncbi:MAG: ABC transporter ATP-binding protein/permease [Eubacterium sp.]|nr:ABC transporter ATP-binding protein/permease [Eubacterium sp.]